MFRGIYLTHGTFVSIRKVLPSPRTRLIFPVLKRSVFSTVPSLWGCLTHVRSVSLRYPVPVLDCLVGDCNLSTSLQETPTLSTYTTVLSAPSSSPVLHSGLTLHCGRQFHPLLTKCCHGVKTVFRY